MKTLFLIAENPDDAELFCEAAMAIRSDLQYKVCTDVVHAVQELASMKIPHLIVIDFGMRTYRGYEVLNDLRRDPLLLSVPIAMLSASMNVVESARLKAMGAQYTLWKPPDFDGYLQILQPILSGV